MRDSAPDGGPPIRERATELDREIVTSDGNREKEILGTEVSLADSWRFKGALPEDTLRAACSVLLGPL